MELYYLEDARTCAICDEPDHRYPQQIRSGQYEIGGILFCPDCFDDRAAGYDYE